jgi:formylglycine-generating enzyme required for sulfatase activity
MLPSPAVVGLYPAALAFFEGNALLAILQDPKQTFHQSQAKNESNKDHQNSHNHPGGASSSIRHASPNAHDNGPNIVRQRKVAQSLGVVAKRTVEGGATIRYETRVLPLLILLGMIQVPAGTFTMGGGEEEDERPRHRVFVSAFSIDRDEVTRAAYQKCVAAGVCARPEGGGDDDLPVTGVSFLDAASYCAWVGKRLPTEAEWEKAARGSDGRIYPWGDEPSCEQANFGNFQGEGRCPKNPGRPVKVGSYPGASPFGVRDLAGNVWEWVADWYDASYYRHSPSRDPRGPKSGERRVVRGGACCSMFGLPRAANRLAFPESYRDIDIGFRCAK